jgi:hypothetical protein
MTRIALRPTRFATVLAAILLSALLAAPVTSTAQKKNQSGGDTYSEIAQAFVASLKKEHINNVVMTDFTGPDGQVTPFGSWLADRLSTANGWAPVDVLDRKPLAAELSGLRSADTNHFDPDKVKDLSLSRDTAVITGSYSGAEGGIGVTMSSITYRKVKVPHTMTIRAKIEFSEEMKSHLTAPHDSLVPSDGIYAEGQGGVATCTCDNYQFSIPSSHGAPNRGMASFSMVINPDGHVSDVSQCEATGNEAADLCKNAMEAPKFYSWACKPAVNVDGKRVPVRMKIGLAYSCGGGSDSACRVRASKSM